MESLPLIESSLSRTEQEFIGFVESHLAGLYQAESDRGLPGDTVRARVSGTAPDEDVVERRHTIEFMSLTSDGHWRDAGCIGHAMKEIESMQGGSLQIESRFVVRVPGLADDQVAHAEIEPVVQSQLERLRAAHLLRTSLAEPVKGHG